MPQDSTSTSPPAVAVVGSAIHAPRNARQRSLEEAIYAVGQSALLDAGLVIDDIDGIVVAANDQLDGRAISIMMASGSVGGVDRDILSTPSAAEHAFVLGALRVATGQFRTQLVVSWSPIEVELDHGGPAARHRSVLPPRAAARRALGARAAGDGARARGAGNARQRRSASCAKNRAQGAMPIRTGRAAPREQAWIAVGHARCAGRCTDAMVTRARCTGASRSSSPMPRLVAERRIGQPSPGSRAWAGRPRPASSAIATSRRLPALAEAARQAYAAGRRLRSGSRVRSRGSIATRRPTRSCSPTRGSACARASSGQGAAGRPLRGRRRAAGQSVGRGARFNPVFCTGLMRIAEAANQVRGRAGNHQVDRACARALAHAASGFAMQYNTVVVMGRERTEVRHERAAWASSASASPSSSRGATTPTIRSSCARR